MKSNFLLALLVFTTSIISRLFFINSNVFFFDGDEAIVALMGLDILDGNFPLYFYGQNYGLAFFEALLVSVGVLIFGTTTLAVKIPMLAFWSVSAVLLALTFYELSGEKKVAIALIMALLVLSPTWLVWSMKARGGYLTSFFFATLIVYLLVATRAKSSIAKWALVGVSAALVFEAQPIWLPCLVPIIAFFLWDSSESIKGKLVNSGVAAVAAALPLGIFAVLKSNIEVAWTTPQPNILKRLTMIDQIPDLLIKNLGGNYFLSTTYEPTNSSYGVVFLVVFVALSGLGLYQAIKHRRINYAVVFLVASLFSFSGFLVKAEPRYLLPFVGFAVLTMVSVFREIDNSTLRKAILALWILVVLVGASALPNFTKYSYDNMSLTKVDNPVRDDEDVMNKLVRKLRAEGVKYVYTTNEFLQYQLNFVTDNEILTVGRKDRCRIPDNVEKIMAAYPEHANEFAIIGYNFQYRYTGKLPLIDNKIFYVVRPPKQALEQVGFFK